MCVRMCVHWKQRDAFPLHGLQNPQPFTKKKKRKRKWKWDHFSSQTHTHAHTRRRVGLGDWHLAGCTGCQNVWHDLRKELQASSSHLLWCEWRKRERFSMCLVSFMSIHNYNSCRCSCYSSENVSRWKFIWQICIGYELTGCLMCMCLHSLDVNADFLVYCTRVTNN